MTLRLVTEPRTDIPVKLKLKTVCRTLEAIHNNYGPGDDAKTLETVAAAIATLVEVERYLTDPQTRWRNVP